MMKSNTMNRILMILVLMAGFFGQTVAQLPNSIPTTIGSNNTRVPGYLRADWGILSTARDTTNKPTFPGLIFFAGDSAWYTWDMHKFTKIGTGSGGGSSNTFSSADFNVSGSNVSIDYTNGQSASASNKGFLTSADWLTFNTKATTATSLGSGYKIAVPSTSTFKSLKRGNGVLLDSATSGELKVSIDSNLSLKSVTLVELSIPVKPDSLFTLGDSFTAGENATTSDSFYVKHIADTFNLPLKNHGVSGSGSWRSAKQHLAIINPGHKALVTDMSSYNDARRNGANRLNLNKIINTKKSIFANQFLKSLVIAGSAIPTRYGSWNTTYGGQSVGGKSLENGAYTNTVSDSITYVFTDSTLVIGGYGGVIAQSFTDSADVYIDGVFKQRISENNAYDGVNDGAYDNERGPMAWIYTGLTYASHKVKIINRHAGKYLILDYFGHLLPPAESFPLLILEVAYSNTAGYAVSPANSSVSVTNIVNGIIDSLVAAFPPGYPVYLVKTNTRFNIATGLSGDNIHPNNLGHRQIATAAFDAFNYSSVYPAATDGTIEYNNNNYYGVQDGNRLKLAFEKEVIKKSDSAVILNQNDHTQLGALNISGASTIKNSLDVGSSDMDGQQVFRAILGTNNKTVLLGSGTNTYFGSFNSAGTASNAMNLHGLPFRIGYVGSSTYNSIFEIDPQRAYAITGLGGLLIDNEIGFSTTIDNANTRAFSIGKRVSNPYWSFYKSDAPTNAKLWDWYSDGTNLYARIANDADNAALDWLKVTRSAMNVSKVAFPNSPVDVGGKLTIGTVVTGSGTDSVLVRDPATKEVRMVAQTSISGGIDSAAFNDLFDERYATLPGDTADTYPAAESGAFITSGGVYAHAQSGNYIFTLTNGANVTSSTFTKGRYIKVGNTVTYSGRLSVTLTAAYTNSVVSITIPIASDFTLADDCTGSITSKDTGLDGAGVGNASTNKIDLQFQSHTLTGAMSIDFNLVYEIK